MPVRAGWRLPGFHRCRVTVAAGGSPGPVAKLQDGRERARPGDRRKVAPDRRRTNCGQAGQAPLGPGSRCQKGARWADDTAGSRRAPTDGALEAPAQASPCAGSLPSVPPSRASPAQPSRTASAAAAGDLAASWCQSNPMPSVISNPSSHHPSPSPQLQHLSAPPPASTCAIANERAPPPSRPACPSAMRAFI